MEKKDFDVDRELIRVQDYTLYRLVYQYISAMMASYPCDGRCKISEGDFQFTLKISTQKTGRGRLPL